MTQPTNPTQLQQIRVVIYVRVSTLEQVDGYSIDEQRARLIAFCKAKGWLIVGIYVDPGHSGAKLDRPEMQRMLNDIGTYDAVLVYKLDRLSRSQKDTLHLIEDVFLPNNIDFVSMSENIDTSTPYGRAMIGILSAFAQLEREQFRERSLMGRSARAKEGLFHGGKHLPIGYDRVDGRLVVNEYEAEQVRMVYDMYLEGFGYNAIAERMSEKYYYKNGGNWSHMKTVKNVLSNNVYLGYIKFQGELIPDCHEPIISVEKWNAVQELRRTKRDESMTQTRSDYLLTGLLFCSNCGARLHAKVKGNTGTTYYTCYSRGHIKSMVKDPNCKLKWWRCDQLDARIDYQIRQLCFDKKQILKLLNKNTPDPKQNTVARNDNIQKRIKEIDNETNKMMELYKFDEIPAHIIAEKISAIQKEKAALEAQLNDKPKEKHISAPPEIAEILTHTAQLWDLADINQKRMLLTALIRRVIVDDIGCSIQWMFDTEAR